MIELIIVFEIVIIGFLIRELRHREGQIKYLNIRNASNSKFARMQSKDLERCFAKIDELRKLIPSEIKEEK